MQRVASSFRSVAGSALRSCVSWSVRASSRSFSGAVCVVSFASASAASAFAALWAGRCGVAVAVRGLLVSVPCLWSPPAPRLSARALRALERKAGLGLA